MKVVLIVYALYVLGIWCCLLYNTCVLCCAQFESIFSQKPSLYNKFWATHLTLQTAASVSFLATITLFTLLTYNSNSGSLVTLFTANLKLLGTIVNWLYNNSIINDIDFFYYIPRWYIFRTLEIWCHTEVSLSVLFIYTHLKYSLWFWTDITFLLCGTDFSCLTYFQRKEKITVQLNVC